MSAPLTPVVPDAVRALAEADFGTVAQRFRDAGFVVGTPARGILTVKGAQNGTRPAVLLSVGVHGDETGPIEMVAHVIEALSRAPAALAVDLMLAAKRPLLYTGGGIINAGPRASKLLRELVADLEAQIKAHGFTPERHVAALYAPPSVKRFWLRTSAFWERTGRKFAPWLAGGVLMVEASKQVYAPTRGGLGAVVRRPLKILEGVGAAEPALGRKSAATQVQAGRGDFSPFA